MSGIAGIVNLDGAPVDRVLLDRMASFLAYRGPDRTGVWSQDSVGFAHTLFATTEEAKREQQPLSLDAQTWITADARIDGRKNLIRELGAHGCRCSSNATAPELILHAYAVWGEQCVDHLLGDFAFAIWDGAKRKLFCARDHFGVKPFFYATVKNTLLFGNSMDVPRLHPDCPDDLHEPAIADFLIFGTSFDLERTAREAVLRLPPAHVLVVAGGEVRVRRYWTLPVDPPVFFRRSRDYVDRFLELFEEAVGDRLRNDRVAVLMSGGLDSSSVAAIAKHVSDKRGLRCSLSAHTQAYHHLIPDAEGHYAGLAARKIGIPWNEFLLDHRELFGYADRPEFRRPEPGWTPMFDWTLADSIGRPLASRVVLTGQGSDGIFSSSRLRHFRNRMRQGRWLLLTQELSRYMLAQGRLRRLQIRGHLLSLFSSDRIPPKTFPEWISPDFDRRTNSRQRYERYVGKPVWNSTPKDAVRPEAYGLISYSMWACLFDGYDPDNFGDCVEARHPFFDLRLIRYVLSLPALPWCTDKELLRRSMRGLLPDEVRLRRKQPIMKDFLAAHYEASRKSWLNSFEPVEGLDRFVDVPRAKEQLMHPRPWELAVHIRPVSLNYWLKWESQNAYKRQKEECRVQTH